MKDFKIKPLIWTREFTGSQFSKILKLQRIWSEALQEDGESGHYYPIQLLPKSNDQFYYTDISCHNNSTNKFHTYYLCLTTMKFEIAKRAYLKALARTKERYPSFDHFKYTDGNRLGERILELTDRSYNYAWHFLENQIWTLFKEYNDTPQGTLREFVDVKPVSTSSSVYMVVDTDSLNRALIGQIESNLNRGIVPRFDGMGGFVEKVDPIQMLEDYFVLLSNPELALLNRKDSRKSLSEPDKKLFAACGKGDPDAIVQALHEGADPNAINEDEKTPIVEFIQNKGMAKRFCEIMDEMEKRSGYTTEDRSTYPSEKEQCDLACLLLKAGAHPDLSGLNEPAALTTAVLYSAPHIVELLLEHGADSGIHAFGDRYSGEWPTAWHYASNNSQFGREYEREGAEESLAILERYPPTPYAEIEPKKSDPDT